MFFEKTRKNTKKPLRNSENQKIPHFSVRQFCIFVITTYIRESRTAK